jgi:hypothetical protein
MSMGKVTFDINDNITAYVEPLYSNVKTTGIIIIRRDGAGAGRLTIAKDNAYLAQALTPAQLALVPAGGLSIGYSGQDFGPSVRSIENELIRVQTGLKGQFGDKWKWDASYLFGQNTSHVAISNTFNTANFRNALDAVNVGGQITCRSAPRWRRAASDQHSGQGQCFGGGGQLYSGHRNRFGQDGAA